MNRVAEAQIEMGEKLKLYKVIYYGCDNFGICIVCDTHMSDIE